MHTLHTIIILNLKLKGFMKILKFTLLFLHTSKLYWLLFFSMLTFFSGLEKIILISLLQSTIVFQQIPDIA
jgi:hypothetical protein